MSQTHFEEIADHYDETFNPHITEYLLQKRIKFIKGLNTGTDILDFGCGTGMLAARLKQIGFNAHGTDPSHNMLEKAKQRGIEVAVCPVERIPYESDRFDLVYCVAVLHHLETPKNVAQSIREMIRVTKPGGKILIWDHNPLNPYWKILTRRLPQDHGDERLVSLGEIKKCFKESGIPHVQYWRQGWLPEFAPKALMPFIRVIEKNLESFPVVKSFSAFNVVVAQKPPLLTNN